MKLRPYQSRAIAELKRRFRLHSRIVAVAPTGSGKTAIGAAFVATKPKARVLWLAHNHFLLDQAVKALIEAGVPASEIGLLTSQKERNPNARILVASIGMLRNRGVAGTELVVIDEAHHVMAAGYRAIVDEVGNTPILGLTATPARLDGQPLGDVFDDLYVIVEAVELQADGFIVGSRVYWVPPEKARALVKGLPSRRGDWSARDLERAMRKSALTEDIVAEWLRLSAGRATLVFASGLGHADDLAARFRAARTTCEVLTGKTDGAEREAILARLSTGETQVVVTVLVLTEGIDCPAVKCVVLARPTKSLTLYRQMCGRGARPPGSRYLVLDEVGNAWRHGSPESAVEWSLSEQPRGVGKQPQKLCVVAQCRFAMPISVMVCPECGAAQPHKQVVAPQKKAKLEEKTATPTELAARERLVRNLAAQRGLGEEWIRAALRGAA